MSGLSNKKLTRRAVLKATGAAGVTLGFPGIVPSSVFGQNAPSNRITIGIIGMGRQAIYINTDPFLPSALFLQFLTSQYLCQIIRVLESGTAVGVMFRQHFYRGGKLPIEFCGIDGRPKCTLRQLYLVGMQGKPLNKRLFRLPLFARISVFIVREHHRL